MARVTRCGQIGQSATAARCVRSGSAGSARPREHDVNARDRWHASQGAPSRQGRGGRSDAPRAQLSNLKPGAAAQGPQARRPRHGLRQGPLLRPRHQGPEVARRARTRCAPASRAARCRSTCASRSCAATRRRDAMPIGPFRTSTQPVNLRDLEPLRGRRRGDAGDADGEGPDQNDAQGRQDARHRRADEEAHRSPCTASRRPRGRRSRRPAAPSRCCGEPRVREGRSAVEGGRRRPTRPRRPTRARGTAAAEAAEPAEAATESEE